MSDHGPGAMAELRADDRPRPGGTPAPSRGTRSFFPLPLLPALPGQPPKSGHARKSFRVSRRCRKILNSGIASLNWLAGHDLAEYEGLAFEPSTHAESLRYLEGLASCQEPKPAGLTPQAAFRALLAGRSDYQCRTTGITMAPYDIRLISWPETSQDAPSLRGRPEALCV